MTDESPASEHRGIQGPDDAIPERPPHPLDDETRQREWDKLFEEYQAEHGAFTEEELAEAHKRMFG